MTEERKPQRFTQDRCISRFGSLRPPGRMLAEPAGKSVWQVTKTG